MTSIHAPSRSLAAVAPKLGNLIRRLGTPFDGEIVATVHALRRTLEGVGLDLHDLADMIEARRLDPCRYPEDSTPAWRFLMPHQRVAWLDLVLHECDLSDWEYRFLSDIRSRIVLFPNWSLSVKQIAQLDRILSQALAAGVSL